MDLFNVTQLEMKPSSHIKSISINMDKKSILVNYKTNLSVFYLYEDVKTEDLLSFYSCESYGKNLHATIYKNYPPKKITIS